MNTICLTTVASRNLTTLFVSCCMLHPQIQTLNHCPSMNESPKTDWLKDYSNEKINNFINRVKHINKHEINVDRDGGVIVTDHAFKGYIKEAFEKRYTTLIKEDMKSIVWKDSPRNTKLLMNQNIEELIKKNDKLRFILIIRNPMDTAKSSSNPGYNIRYRDPSKEEILTELFERYEWFFENEKKDPKHFMHFFQDEVSDELLERIEGFLMVDRDDRWRDDFKKSWVLKVSYDHASEFKELYKSLIDKYNFDNREKFEKFTNEK